MKQLVGNQDRLPLHLQEKIKASPAKQTTYGEIMHEKHVENMEKGKATKPVDKAKALWDAMTSDVTYSDAKKEYRKKRKAEYEANHPESPAKACWDGYEMIGMKKKGGKNVPNCVPKKK